MKVLLILVDGMRPDAITDIPQAQAILQRSVFTLRAQTVMPSVTLPCHMSLFHSVDPSRHGTTTNIYTPQVRPIQGLCELLAAHGRKSAFFYNWEELRDLSRPGSLDFSFFYSGSDGYQKANDAVTDAAIEYLSGHEIDFSFLYLGYPDEAGHRFGWMGEEYRKSLVNSWDNITRVMNALPKEYTCIITADHGGHERMHGTDLPEDMTIPLVITDAGISAGQTLENANIKDIAPTVANLLGITPDKNWEGHSLL